MSGPLHGDWWSLRFDGLDGSPIYEKDLVGAGDECGGAQAHLLFASEEDARMAAEWHLAEFDIPCHPVRLALVGSVSETTKGASRE